MVRKQYEPPTSVRFKRETRDRLREEADNRRWSVTLLVEVICEEWLARGKRARKKKA